MPLWTLDELLNATGGAAQACAVAAFDGVSIDSRDVSQGDVFVAIKGDRFDGHDFVATALDNGAGIAVVSKSWVNETQSSQSLLMVDDPLVAMEQLAFAARKRCKGKIVAVTGSVGKTSTKEAIRLVLEAAGKTHASIKSFNNHWGVPLMLSRMPRDTEFGVFEVGMSHAGEIGPLAKMISPHVAVITNVGEAHLENFEDISGIADAKSEVFAGLLSGGRAIVGVDHPCAELLLENAEKTNVQDVLTVGFSEQAQVRIENSKLYASTFKAEVTWSNQRFDLQVPQLGRHALSNAAVALLVSESLGLDVETTLNALQSFVAPSGRGAVIELNIEDGSATLLDESYNANPVSMRAALGILGDVEATGRKIAVLGDMLELGDGSAQIHETLMADVVASGAQKLYLVGPQMRHLNAKLVEITDVEYLENTAGLGEKLISTLANGDVVMVKGSNGIGLGPIVEQLKSAL